MHDSIQKPRKTDPGASTSTNGETAPHADGHNEHECPVSQSIPQPELEVVDQGDTAKTKSPRSKTPTLGDLATVTVILVPIPKLPVFNVFIANF